MKTFYIVDAFTETRFGGNPAGVVIFKDGEDYPDDETMRKTAAELRYSETAFVKPLGKGEFRLRYFTPAAEVDLCGHATIGSFAALLDFGLVERGKKYLAHTLAGDIDIEISDEGNVVMGMATPTLIDTMYEEDAIEELYKVMGGKYAPVLVKDEEGNEKELVPAMVSTGLPDIMMPLASREALFSLEPDMKALSALSERYGVVGVHAFTLDTEGPEIKTHARNFAPLYDIDEEAATGTSSGAMTYYLFLQGQVEHGKENVFIQGETMGRPSRIVSRLYSVAGAKEGEGVSVKVGGSAYILAKGEFDI